MKIFQSTEIVIYTRVQYSVWSRTINPVQLFLVSCFCLLPLAATWSTTALIIHRNITNHHFIGVLCWPRGENGGTGLNGCVGLKIVLLVCLGIVKPVVYGTYESILSPREV